MNIKVPDHATSIERDARQGAKWASARPVSGHAALVGKGGAAGDSEMDTGVRVCRFRG
ncbi:MAG TPA: hypothetical protein VFI65_01160 [Streptosporangiaceae bacterium]|nr:hypothetical protein [Streptosporangiaceae bacterium]